MSWTLKRFLISVALVMLASAPVGAAELTEQAVRAYYAAWTDGDVDTVASYCTADAVYEDVATPEDAS